MARKRLWQLLLWFAIHKLAKIKGPDFVNHYPVDKEVSNAQPLTPSSRRAKNQASVSNFARQPIPTHLLIYWIQYLSVHSSPSHVLTGRKPQRELTCDQWIWQLTSSPMVHSAFSALEEEKNFFDWSTVISRFPGVSSTKDQIPFQIVDQLSLP